MFNNRVLIVCEEWSLAKALSMTFDTSRFAVRTALSAKEARAVALQFLPALVVVDLDLLVADGFDFCWKLRNSSFTRHVRILMLSAGRGDYSELLGLSRGADDYVLKPIQSEHLMYRVRILLKQKTTHEQNHFPISQNGVNLDFDRRTALLDGFDLGLTVTEFNLIWAMAFRPGIVFNRFELVRRCRGDDANCLERTIDVHIRSLRRKLGKSSYLVETVRGVGYRFRDPTDINMVEPENDQDSASPDELADCHAPTSASIDMQLTAT